MFPRIFLIFTEMHPPESITGKVHQIVSNKQHSIIHFPNFYCSQLIISLSFKGERLFYSTGKTSPWWRSAEKGPFGQKALLLEHGKTFIYAFYASTNTFHASLNMTNFEYFSCISEHISFAKTIFKLFMTIFMFFSHCSEHISHINEHDKEIFYAFHALENIA